MPLTLRQLLAEAGRAKPNADLSSTHTATAEEVDAAFEALNGVFSFNRFTGGLQVNQAVELAQNEQQVVQRLADGFREKLHVGQVRLSRGANGVFVPAAMEPEIERAGTRTDS